MKAPSSYVVPLLVLARNKDGELPLPFLTRPEKPHLMDVATNDEIGVIPVHYHWLPSFTTRGASSRPKEVRRGRSCCIKQLSKIRRGGDARLQVPVILQTSTIRRGGDDGTQQVPVVLQPWIYLYNAVPTMVVPFTTLDVSFTIFSALVLTCMDYSIALILHRLGWPGGTDPDAKQTRAVAGSLTTIFHSTSLVTCLGACLSSHQFAPSSKMSDAPQWWQDAAHALIQFCTGYMIYDAAIQFLADKWVEGVGPVLSQADWMFLGHHAATSLYMTSARILEAGHVSAMILMAGGEITAPFQNALRISRIATQMDMGGTSFWHVWLPYVKYVWAVLYAFFRILVGPACAIHLTQDLVFTKQGRAHVPLGMSIVWLTMCWAVILGSLPWIYDAAGIIRQGIP